MEDDSVVRCHESCNVPAVPRRQHLHVVSNFADTSSCFSKGRAVLAAEGDEPNPGSSLSQARLNFLTLFANGNYISQNLDYYILFKSFHCQNHESFSWVNAFSDSHFIL